MFIEPFDKTRLAWEAIVKDQMYAAIHRSHPLAASTGPLPFEALDGQNMVTGPIDNVLVRFFDHCANLSHIQPQRIMSSSFNVDFINSMSRNIGIAPLTSAMAFQITNPDIRIRQLILPIPGNLYICWAKNNPNQKAIRHFSTFCRDYFICNPVPSYMANPIFRG